jgi:2-(1,2-epoxy-1,2-dihydrophenyl)acetyl-CoA isomerase
MIAMAGDAFIQPYYAEVGFAPDGGWTALLPERIGAARAANILMLNRRLGAEEAHDLGIVDAVPPAEEFDAIVGGWIAALTAKEPESLSATRRLLWDAERIATVRRRLMAERRAFVALVGREVVAARMRNLIGGFARTTA